MDPKETTVAANDNFFEVPEGIRRARAAFIRDFPVLIANRRTRGKYVCYHNDVCVAVTNNYFDMIEEVNKKNVPENASLILKVTQGEDREQQLIADEADIDQF